MPPPEVPPVNLEEEETYELEQLSSGDVIIGLSSFGAVDEEEVLTTDQKRDMALDVSARISDAGRPFRFDICHPHLIGSDPIPADGPDDHAFRKELTKALDFHCRDPESGGNYWRVTMGGRFHYVPHQRVWLNWKQWNCEKTGGSEIVDLLLIHCEAFYPDGENYPSGTRFKGPIAAMGEFRFAAGAGQWVAEARGACLSVGGWLYPNSRVSSEGYYEAPLEYQRPKYIIPGVEECPGISVRLESE
jgi:hypothetical protein